MGIMLFERQPSSLFGRQPPARALTGGTEDKEVRRDLVQVNGSRGWRAANHYLRVFRPRNLSSVAVSSPFVLFVGSVSPFLRSVASLPPVGLHCSCPPCPSC